MDLDPRWDGILFSWDGTTANLNATTRPPLTLPGASLARERFGPDDIAIVLAENNAYATRYELGSGPVTIGPEDLCPTCEILDGGSPPPPNHSLFYRSFARSGRQFDLFVEFGRADPSADDLAAVNRLLATLQVDPSSTPPAVETARPVAPAPVSVDLPSGWVEKDVTPGTSAPRVVAGYGNWDFPSGGHCGPEPALERLPADGALVWLVEYAQPGNAVDFIDIPTRFSIDLQIPPARWECAAAAPSRRYLFRSGERYFEVYVSLGRAVTAATIEQAEELIGSLEADG
jgi:hypothetical protein